MDQSVERIRQAVEEVHSAKASFVRVVAVREAFEGQLVWEGIVHVFALGGTPRPSAPTPGPRPSRVLTAGASMPCCTCRLSARRPTR
jgi:hypothetical protein